MSGPGRATVLVVDDEEGIRRSLAGLLADEGYRAVPACDADSALEAMDREDPDLALLDVLLPGTGGMEILERLQAEYPGFPVIMMSGHGTIDVAVKATKMGAYDFLEKPLDPPKLLITIQRALEHARLHRENLELRTSVAGDLMLGSSPAMVELREAIALAAPTTGRVLITGENGTGKELVARALHEQSDRRDYAFVKMNCAAIPRELVESELFGHERGAFTGAARLRRGKFERAHQGTLLLDEVGDMSLEVQAKLLRVLEEGEVERVGGGQPIPVSVRVVAATNKHLPQEIAEGRFREDLFYRLSVIPIRVPPLRERSGDIPLLARHFLAQFARENNRRPRELTPGAIAALEGHPWPGNVRELKNLVERLVIMGGGRPVEAQEVEDLLQSAMGLEISPGRSRRLPWHEELSGQRDLRTSVEEYEASVIRDAMERANWNISEAAKTLQTDRANLHRKMRRLGIRRPDRDGS